MPNKTTPISLKIKQARLAKGLTQGELAGDEISRNMMCRIETGTATPSRATLAYLADRLDLPLLYLLDETLTLEECYKHLYMDSIRHEFASAHYAETLRLIHRYFNRYDDELALIAATALTHLAERKLHDGNLESADKLVREACTLTSQTIYPTEHLDSSLNLLAAITANVQSPRYEIDEKQYLLSRNRAVNSDLFAYLTDNLSECSDPLLCAHLAAREKLRSRDYRGALAALEELEMQRSEKNLSAFLLFRIYTDLENCHRELGDYQSAYRYANKRISMLAAFKS